MSDCPSARSSPLSAHGRVSEPYEVLEARELLSAAARAMVIADCLAVELQREALDAAEHYPESPSTFAPARPKR